MEEIYRIKRSALDRLRRSETFRGFFSPAPRAGH